MGVEGGFCELRRLAAFSRRRTPSRVGKGHDLRLPWVWEPATDKAHKGGTHERYRRQVPGGSPQIEAFEFDPPAIAEEGQESKGIIKLSGPAPPDTSITLEGSPANAEFPGVLPVPSLQTQVTFTAVATGSVEDFRDMTFTAHYFSSTKEARLSFGGVV
jgi:hypothetical protein